MYDFRVLVCIYTREETHTQEKSSCVRIVACLGVYIHTLYQLYYTHTKRDPQKRHINKNRARVYVLLRVWVCMYTHHTGCITHTERDTEKTHT